jgi:hypothetical protein
LRSKKPKESSARKVVHNTANPIAAKPMLSECSQLESRSRGSALGRNNLARSGFFYKALEARDPLKGNHLDKAKPFVNWLDGF